MAANNAPSALDKEQIFGMAEKEMEYRVELFNKYKESELNMGENSCIDRCVSKYWQVNSLIGQLLGSSDHRRETFFYPYKESPLNFAVLENLGKDAELNIDRIHPLVKLIIQN